MSTNPLKYRAEASRQALHDGSEQRKAELERRIKTIKEAGERVAGKIVMTRWADEMERLFMPKGLTIWELTTGEGWNELLAELDEMETTIQRGSSIVSLDSPSKGRLLH